MWTGDVSGWAPTADTFFYNRNWCVAGGPQFIKEDGKDPGVAHYSVSTPQAVVPFYVERMTEGGALKKLKVADLREFTGM